MSHSYPIWNTVKRTPKFATKIAFGCQESFEQRILVGTSATNSHELGVIRVERRALPDGVVEFSLYLDDILVRRGLLDGKALEIEDTAGVDDDGDATFSNLGYRADDNVNA